MQKKEKILHLTAKGIASMLTSKLYTDANSTTCTMLFQPKAPESLEKFKKVSS